MRSALDRFFEFSLLGLLASGFLAVAGSGYLDLPTVTVTSAALVVRGLLVAGWLSFEVPSAIVTAVTLAYIGFYPLDYYYISRSFIPTAVHLVFFVAVVKILTGRSNRDYLFLKVIALMELLAACVLSSSLNFFFFTLLFLGLGVATFASDEIRQASMRAGTNARIPVRGLSRRLSAVSVSVSIGILVITAGLFFFLPRTARAAFQHLASHRYHLAGFSNHVSLGEIGEIKKENTPVMHIKMDHPENRMLALKWRGASLSEFNGRAWFNRVSMGQVLRPDPQGLISLGSDDERRRAGRFISYAVYLNDLASEALFFAGSPEFLRIDSTVVRRPFDNYSVQFPEARSVWYQAYSRLEPDATETADKEPIAPLPDNLRAVYLQLPALDVRIPALTHRIVGSSTDPAIQARLIENHLRTEYGYTLELPTSEPDDPLAFFLFHRRKGHCEYFASAMAVMLRVEGIPSRVVTGFQSGIYNPISKSILIRTSDAHSWVEAWLPGRGWITFDPTPPDPNPQRVSAWTRLGFYVDAAGVFWGDWVLNYNLDRQLQLAARVGETSRHVTLDWFRVRGLSWGTEWSTLRDWARHNATWLAGLAVAALLLLTLGPSAWRSLSARRRVHKLQRGQGDASDATALYHRLLVNLKRRGIEKPAWLTPTEFAHVLEEPELSLLVEDLTCAYNELRFGGKSDAAVRLVRLVERLEAMA